MRDVPQGARRQGHPRRRHPGVPARREDRRRRAERRGQVDRAEDHGRAGPALQRRRPADAGLHGRHAGAGAAARRDQDRPRQRRGGRRRDQGAARPVQRDRRADGDRLLRRAAGRDGQAAGAARPPRTPGIWTAGSSRRWTRCAARRRTPTCSVLSGGERRRVALCKLLLDQPDLLLLDEPTNHLDAESVQWLEQHLAKYPGTVLAVTHDRYFLDNVAEWILELDRGRAYPYEGNYSTYLETKADPAQGRGPEGRQAAQAARGRARVGAVEPAGRQAKSKARLAALRGDGGRGRPGPQARLRGDPDPAGPAPGQHGRRGQRA